MKNFFLVITLLFSTSIFAQYTITIDAYVLDEKTQQPIPFVNIQCVGKDLKAVTNELGKFTVTFDEGVVNDTDVFEFEALNYEMFTVEMAKLKDYLLATNKIYLSSTKQTVAQHTVSGVVYNEEKQSIQNVMVRVKNSFVQTQTNVDGSFTIPAIVGDVLEIDFIGMNPYEFTVRDNNPINITMTSNGELLDEVVLKGEKAKKIKRYVDTGFGEVDVSSFGDANVLTSEDISENKIFVTDVLRGRIPGLQVFAGESNVRSRFGSIRNFNPAGNTRPTQPGQPILVARGREALIFYDGNPFYGNINDINVSTIDNIVVVKSLARTVLYGGRPAILITSKNRFITRDANGNAINSALATGNDYKETIKEISEEDNTDYIVALKKATTYEEALKIYETQSKKDINQTVPYYIDVADYFLNWNKEKAIAILSNIEQIAGNNPKALKAYAYKLDEWRQYEKAKLVYQKIATLLPNAAQSYRDLAVAYKQAGNYQESLDLYVKMLTNTLNDVDFSGLDKPMLGEIQQLLRRHRVDLEYDEIPSNLLTATFNYDVRIVFEWNEVDTEFELQFVNPQQKFYRWEHSVVANKETMLSQVKNGYYMKEFIIDDEDTTGEWIINVKTLENEKPFNPTYLKYTVYKNYGEANEEKTVRVVKLYKQQQKVTLDKIFYEAATEVSTR